MFSESAFLILNELKWLLDYLITGFFLRSHCVIKATEAMIIAAPSHKRPGGAQPNTTQPANTFNGNLA